MPPLPPPPPIDCAKMPFDSAPSVSTVPVLAARTAPPLPPLPADSSWFWPIVWPWVVMEPCELNDWPLLVAESDRFMPLLPPPPPIDCAWIPAEFAPWVWILPADSRSTAPAVLPVPPPPPRLTPTALPLDSVSAPEKPPLPPPPPIDCANRPTELSFVVRMVPVLPRWTLPPVPPEPPVPPSAMDAARLLLPTVMVPETAKPPLPPPPPSDCARTPSDCVPVVVILPVESTETPPPRPPVPPPPPIDRPSAPYCEPATEAEKPPLPPPPPTDCASMPFDMVPPVRMLPLLVSRTTPPLPPMAPLPPKASDAAPYCAPEAATAKPPLPPPPPSACANRPFD